jgi:hypothetical protein
MGRRMSFTHCREALEDTVMAFHPVVPVSSLKSPLARRPLFLLIKATPLTS